jgi:hypothetical protein
VGVIGIWMARSAMRGSRRGSLPPGDLSHLRVGHRNLLHARVKITACNDYRSDTPSVESSWLSAPTPALSVPHFGTTLRPLQVPMRWENAASLKGKDRSVPGNQHSAISPTFGAPGGWSAGYLSSGHEIPGDGVKDVRRVEGMARGSHGEYRSDGQHVHENALGHGTRVLLR